MASKLPAERDEKLKLRTRKGLDMTCSSDKHAEKITFYCKEHKLTICDRCAIKDHQKPCKLDDIEDVILEKRGQLDEKQQEIDDLKKQLKTLDYKIDSSATFSSNHFQSVNDKLKVAFEDKIKSLKDKEERAIRLLNENAEHEIRLINEKREKRIKLCNIEAEQQKLIVKESQAKCESETKAINEMVANKIKDLKSKNQHTINTIDNIDARIKRIKQDDETLVNEAPEVLASFDDMISSKVHQDVMDCLDRIRSEVQRVKFVEGEVGGDQYTRIDDFIGKWELVKSIHIPSIVNDPWVCGLISNDEICVRDDEDNAAYVTNISTQHTHNVIEGGSKMCITSCAPIDSNVIVCGKEEQDCTADSLDGCITLYDRQWQVIRDITIPRDTSYVSDVNVDVDRDGMILAAQYFGSNIYVINPAEGKMVDTITTQGKKPLRDMKALSSGDIVVKTGSNQYTVISRSGEEKAVIHSDEWYASRCHVDTLTDTLYITYLDRERTVYSVDQVSCDGIIQARRIVDYETSDRSTKFFSLVTPTGNLVACNGDKLFVYKKRFIV